MDYVVKQAHDFDKDYDIYIVLFNEVKNANTLLESIRQGDVPAAVLSTKLVCISKY